VAETGSKTGLAKFEHDPGEAFMRLFVDVCAATELKGFNPQELANTINGEAGMSSLTVMTTGNL
jgi:hypothetical protein